MATAVEVWRNSNKHMTTAPTTAATATVTNPNGLARLFPILFTFQPNPFLTIREYNSPAKPNLNKISILAAADRCLHMLTEFASRNPLLIKLFSMPSNFRSFFQIGRENDYRSRRNRIPLLSSNHNFAAILPGDSVAGVVVSNGVMNFLNIYNTLLVVRLVLTWFPNAPPAIVSPLSTLCDPYLNIFRGLIPPLGGTLDLSPILAFLVLNAFTSTAAALPAELPSSTVSSTSAQPCIPLPKAITSSQEKWFKRMHRIRVTSNGGHEAGTR